MVVGKHAGEAGHCMILPPLGSRGRRRPRRRDDKPGHTEHGESGGWKGVCVPFSVYASAAMDEAHLWAAIRYVALNPVRARLVARARDWPWSSVHAHLKGEDDGLVTVRPVLDRVERFAELMETDADDPAFAYPRAAEGTGRPLGTADFVADLERRLGRPIARRAPGRKPAPKPDDQLMLL